MRVICPPEKIVTSNSKSIFLAGSIEMGKARFWQDELIEKLSGALSSDSVLIALNPRRKDWDSSWIQEKTNPPFHEQVSWELEGLEKADYIIYYFQADTMSPITLLELGLYARSKKIIVLCEEGFYRKGNIDIVCERYNIPQCKNLDEAVAEFLKHLIELN